MAGWTRPLHWCGQARLEAAGKGGVATHWLTHWPKTERYTLQSERHLNMRLADWLYAFRTHAIVFCVKIVAL